MYKLPCIKIGKFREETVTITKDGEEEGKKATITYPATSSTYEKSENYDAFGASAEIAYASDTFSAKLDADFGMKKTVEKDAEFEPGFDLAANTVVSALTIDAYYQYGKKVQFVSAQVKADLNTFEVPVVLTIYGKDVANSEEGQTLGGKAVATLNAFTVAAGGSYTLSDKKYNLEGSVEYKAEMFKVSAGLNFSKTAKVKKTAQLYANASIESDTLVPGATLALEYGPNTADGKINEKKAYSYATTNFLDEDADKGAVTASCTIKF